ncbi:MAG: MraY family glycosyltransferase [Bacteroidota bacterium]
MDRETALLVFTLYFFCAVFFSTLINGLFLRFTHTLGIRNHPEEIIRWSPKAKPSIGGISFYIVFLFSITSYFFIFRDIGLTTNIEFLGMLLACTVAFLMGLADDAYNTKPLLKLLVQVFCAVILIWSGIYIKVSPNEALNYTLTVFWVVGIMNSINMLDNMDGIATTVSIYIIFAAIATMLIRHSKNDLYFTILTGVVASLIGFLKFNWHPSKMFMGDTGSQFLGAFLAIIGIEFFWNGKDVAELVIQTKQIASVILVFLLPLCDTSNVFIRRLLKGKSPFIGGKDHTTHHLVYAGLSEKQVAGVFTLLSVISVSLMILIQFIPDWNLIYFSLVCLYALLVFIVLLRVTIKYQNTLEK